MSGLSALFQRDGRPIPAGLLDAMLDVVPHRGPDGRGVLVRDHVGLGFLALHTTPESAGCVAPLHDPEAGLLLVLDGRLDNRDALCRALGVEPTSADAEILLQAYKRWGSATPAHLIGDFAFAIWDERRQALLCARDVFGAKPFVYHASPRTFACATEIRQLLEHPQITRAPNEGMVAEYLVCDIRSEGETLYRDIQRLPPAHALLVTRDSLRIFRYFSFDPEFRLRYRDAREYAEHCRELFFESVRARLRATTAAGIELSGGLDSSSVVCVADMLSRSGPTRHPHIETFSMVFPGLACDETPYIDAVLQGRGLRSHRVPPEPQTLALFTTLTRRFQDFAGHPNGANAIALYRLAAQRGVHVMLTGVGGDDWLQGADTCTHDAMSVRSGDVLAPFDAGLKASRHRLLNLARRGLARHPSVQTALARRAIRRRAPWLSERLAERLVDEGRLREAPPFNASDAAQSAVLACGLLPWGTHAAESQERIMALYGVEPRHPFRDVRLAAFALALPESQRRAGLLRKVVLRDSLRNILPQAVLARTDKATFGYALQEALGSATAREPHAAFSRGWIGGNGFAKRPAPTWERWMLVGIDLCFDDAHQSRDACCNGQIP